MQTSYKRFSVVVGFLLLLALLIANAFVTKRQVDVQVANEEWVAHTGQVQFELTQTESLIREAETGQRGFLYTGDAKYLTPYERAIKMVGSHIDNLEKLTADNPSQQPRVAELRRLAEAKQSELAQTITYYRAGKTEDARALVLSDQGLVLMEQIRSTINAMRDQERSLQAKRTEAYEKSVRVTIGAIYIASAMAILGLVLLAYYILREIELRERHGRQIAEREEWFRGTLTSLGDGVIATDGEGRVTFLNLIAEELMGVKLAKVQGRVIHEIFPIFNESTHEPVENPVKKVMELGRVVGLANHTILQRTDGAFIPIEDSAAPIRDSRDRIVGVVLVFRDATFERQSQELLRRSEKLAAAARLSATVAHEINNPLEAIGNLIYLVKGTDGLPAVAEERLALAEQELERVSYITRQTLGFYRESKVPDRIEMQALVESVLRIHSNKFQTKNITIERDFQECPSIQGLSGELKQVVANLISNAADAVPDGGTIWVRLACLDGPQGKLVKVSVEDDGHGIAEEYRDRIFEPFFTTKKDVGTGLGLWVSKEIVDRHGGTIEVQARANGNGSKGTVFHIHLPLTANVSGVVRPN